MLIAYNEGGSLLGFAGYHSDYTDEMVDNLHPIEGYGNHRIYDAETINRVWRALDTGGTVSVELNGDGNVVDIITENGDLEPPEDIPPQPTPTPIEQLGIEMSEREINEIIHGIQISDLEIRLLMGGL